MRAALHTRARRFAEVEWKLLSDLIEARFGLVFDDSRREILESRLAPRLDELHLDTFSDYYHYLRFHPRREIEFSRIAGSVTNGETYFFRERHHFDILRDHVLKHRVPLLRSRPLRVLSAGCSSGQEPYSIAMVLREAARSLPPLAWEVDACDVNPLRVAEAREALYGETSLRACDAETRERYFQPENGRYRVRPVYRGGVSVFEANLARDDGADWPPYDAIFCRNVLIYFSDAAFRSAIALFARCLAPGGYLFLGHSESLINRKTEFQPECIGGKIVYRKEEARPSFDCS